MFLKEERVDEYYVVPINVLKFIDLQKAINEYNNSLDINLIRNIPHESEVLKMAIVKYDVAAVDIQV